MDTLCWALLPKSKDCCIGSKFCKFYLIKTNFTLGELVYLVTFSIATKIAEETKRKFLLLWQRCGGGVRFLRDGRRSIVSDIV